MKLWSVLRSPLVLEPRFVATSQFTSIADGLFDFSIVRNFGWWEFSNKFQFWKYFLNAFNTFTYHFCKSQVPSFRTSLQTSFMFNNFVPYLHIFFVLQFFLMFLFLTFQLILIFYFNFLIGFLFRERIQSIVDRLWWNDFAKINSKFWLLATFAEKLHPAFLTGF